MLIRRLSMAFAMTTVLLAACGDEDGPSDPGFTETFALTIAGDVTGSVTGKAYFGADEFEGEPVFGIGLSDASETHTLILVKFGSGRPAVGTYDITETGAGEDEWTALYLMEDGEVSGMVVGIEGTISFSRSTSGRLTGTVEFTGTGFAGDGEVLEEIALDIDGTFDAKPAEE